jgi:aminoglycoside 2'-N-acetyltransferase I
MPLTRAPQDAAVWHVHVVQEHTTVRQLTTEQLTAGEIVRIRELLWAAFPAGDEGFTEDDWEHGLGGQHFVVDQDGDIVSHASVVEREIHIGDVPLRTGYVESVATRPDRQRQGLGSALMGAATAHIRATFELGVLGTGEHAFYERLGWHTWRGPAFVRTADGPVRTPDEEGFILVLRTPASPPFDDEAPISCDWRPGDVW